MKITLVRSDEAYRKMAASRAEDRDYIYRNDIIKPFEFKYKCIGVPLKAEGENGYDVVSMAPMSGLYKPSDIDEGKMAYIDAISDDGFWKDCEKAIMDTLKGFESHGVALKVQDYFFTVQLSDPQNPMSAMTGDYCGDGGIPGYIIGTIIPNEKSLKMLPVALAHETDHNVRWQYMQWNPKITLGDMIVSEGLAERFAALMFGEDKVGMWVKNTSKEDLEKTIKPMVKDNLYESDFNKVSSFLYGDDIMAMRGGKPIGMPYCGGYACGYELIKYYLEKTGKTIYEATVTSTKDILKETEGFWQI